MATLNFDARTVAPQTGFEPLPVGWYNVIVDESEMKPTKAGDGSCYLKVRYSVLDGQFGGRKLFGNINLQNANPQATEIGLKQLSALAHAVGVLLVQDSQQLHNIPLKIKVKIRTDKTGEYEPQNDITQWKNINEPTDAVAGLPAAAPAAAAPSWQQPAAQPAAQPAWAGAPVAQPTAQPTAAAQPAWQAPAAAVQQPWAAPAAAAAAAAQPAAAPGPATAGFNPAGAVPPWAAR